jgi:hypothetical protein
MVAFEIQIDSNPVCYETQHLIKIKNFHAHGFCAVRFGSRMVPYPAPVAVDVYPSMFWLPW